MITFKTETNSVYVVDEKEKLIMRKSGENSPTDRQGQDGVFKKYETISNIEVGKRVIIDWGGGEELFEGSPSDATPVTLTSPVAEIAEDKDELGQ